MRVRLAGRRVPTRVTWIVGVGSALIAGFLPIRQAAELITFLDPVTWLRFGAWFLLGALVYALYGYRRSALARRDEDTADRAR
ncbi:MULTISPECIES: amino acid permease C-terminal domain-containing protein [Micromonospora]|uniref:amino acid permease C-terminal domain-containing protein n=1 Tax=Micromonospora TaxID=1873 RepID=UPI003C24CA09